MGAEINGKLIHEPRKASPSRQEPSVQATNTGSLTDNAS
jgi:hypothetical protein